MKKLYRVKFSLIHEGCWTSKIRDDRVVTLRLSQYNRRKVHVLVASSKLIVRDLKTSDNVDDILKFRKMKGGYVIEFLEDLDTTISGAILESGSNVLEYSNTVKAGMEKWEVITTSKALVNQFAERFKVNDLTVHEMKFPELFGSGLTEKEMLTLKTALSMGYFNYPRSVKAKDIAESLGVSKQDFLYHLRNSINKIVSSYDLG
ncbi:MULTISPECIES: helix-turn-helix domain-containing protein [Metallosphaera]|uniref:helix-turn-helix domain-containing protein n=1 Tax=Metallosphaera TaxID=41980 RepID=UPI001F070238|nr:helix-turn-helix domain-containing protein [Metallosphaera sedula]MCH1771438.1 helix-turn-helix domain-containing protein [Metallosphaera sedula]MCP6729829.1 helix-turn-helix domain-containing protein [Metallosphaera sedula]BBL47962.1 XRE family transcriptional regulator [Metallosphaera sedula]